MTKRDYYEVLGVAREATAPELKSAYRKLAAQFHPDRNQDDPTAEDKFKEASEAYRVLSDPEQRKRYDRHGHGAFESSGPGGFDPTDFGSFGDVLEGLFGDLFARRRAKRNVGRDIEYDMHVTFESAALGSTETIKIERPQPCEHCSGVGAEPGSDVRVCAGCKGTGEVRFQRGFFAASRNCPTCSGTGKRIQTPCSKCTGSGSVMGEHELEVRLPAGVSNGAVRTVRSAGEIGRDGSGDLHITVRVKEHPLFERDGADVLCTIPVSFPQAVLGTTLEVPTLQGKVHMKLPPGTQSGKVFRLRGKGIPVYGGMGKGDQMVSIMVEVPDKVTREQRKLIEALADEMGTETHPHRASFMDKLKGLFD